jgi:hypothetical protein
MRNQYWALIEWKDEQTGKMGVFNELEYSPESGSIWEDEEGFNTYMWDEGNCSCDCNRSIFFLGLPYGHHEPCGDDRFTITSLKAMDKDGNIVKVFD